mgnify:CR=1 FL=1
MPLGHRLLSVQARKPHRVLVANARPAKTALCHFLRFVFLYPGTGIALSA